MIKSNNGTLKIIIGILTIAGVIGGWIWHSATIEAQLITKVAAQEIDITTLKNDTDMFKSQVTTDIATIKEFMRLSEPRIFEKAKENVENSQQ